ncbi:MAG: ABC transporter permease [Acidobacteriia bacterium]|nr:ABC transporter permease [Terriglobia bacterium]
MRKVWLIIKREYLTRVKTKGFVIGTLIVPLLGIAFGLLVTFLVSHQPIQNLRLAIVDNSGGLAASVTRGLNGKLENGKPEFTVLESIERPASLDSAAEGFRNRINAGTLDAYLVIPSDLNRPAELHTKNPGNFALIAPLTVAVNQAVIEARLNARGVHLDDVGEIVRSERLQLIKVSKSGESVERGQTIGVAVGLVILLYTSLLMYGILTMRSVLEEKTTRTMEVLISAVRPFELLAGKILGVAAVAFTQFLIWTASLALLLSYGAFLAAMVNPGSSFPGVHLPVSLLICVLVYFCGGYFLYSAMFAAVGAACSSEQDAAQLQWLAMAPLVFCMVIYSLVLTNPSSTTSVVLSEIPFFSPVLMTLRISLQTPPFWQIALSMGLLSLTTVGVIYGSARIYRVGILMYGKRPTLPELLRWLRYT